MSDSKFSSFIRNATEEEKAEVYTDVMDKASKRQIDSINNPITDRDVSTLIVPDLIKQAIKAVKESSTTTGHAKLLSYHDYDVITRPYRDELAKYKALSTGDE